MKKIVVIMVIAIAIASIVSCENNSKKQTTSVSNSQDHKPKDGSQLAFVCPMDCEKGKSYEAEGKCPICNMKLVEHKHSEDGDSQHSKNKELTPEEKEPGHSHGDEGHKHD